MNLKIFVRCANYVKLQIKNIQNMRISSMIVLIWRRSVGPAECFHYMNLEQDGVRSECLIKLSVCARLLIYK